MKKLFITTAIVMLSLSAQAQKSASLEADTLQEVVVTGTNEATEKSRLPYSVTTISREQLEATGQNQLLSALSGRIPSFFVTERNIFGFGVSTGGSGGIKIRGVGSSPTSQVLMMVDGKPQFAGVYSHPVADNYETDFVDHVEIVRGPASVLYGSNAMGGAVNLITHKPGNEKVRTIVTAQYGMYNTVQTSATNMVHIGKFSSLISGGYDRTDGTQKDFDFWQGSGYVKLGYDFSDHWNLYADYSIMKFNGNDPIYSKLSNPESTDIYHQNVLRGEASAVVGNSYSKTDGAVRLYFGHGTHKIEDPKPFESKDNRIGLLAYQNYKPWKSTCFTLGFDFDRYSGEIPLSGGFTHEEATKKGMPTTMGREYITEYSPYLTASQGLWGDRITLSAGMRVACSDKFGANVIPQGGFTINPGKQWTVKASVAKGYRNPSFKELYLYKMANPDLNPESMMNYEVSVGKSFSHWFDFEVTAYIAKGSNLIQSVFSDELKHMLNVNTGEFTNKGFEVVLNSHPFRPLHLHATYSYLHTNLDNLTGAPKHQYSFGADWRIIKPLLLNVDVRGVAGLYVADDVDIQNYATLNMRLTYSPNRYVDLHLQGNNLTNARYCINKGYEMPGATVMGGVKVKF